jgi:hypothetical protein
MPSHCYARHDCASTAALIALCKQTCVCSPGLIPYPFQLALRVQVLYAMHALLSEHQEVLTAYFPFQVWRSCVSPVVSAHYHACNVRAKQTSGMVGAGLLELCNLPFFTPSSLNARRHRNSKWLVCNCASAI